MAYFDDPPLHDFPDRAIRALQSFPAHLCELVQDVAPTLAPRLDFEQTRPLERDFPLPDWRRREADLLFHVPFRGAPYQETLLCLLIEHQSAADPPAPLRTLWYAVLYWERQWRGWSERHPRGEPLRLHPVLPILLHTGAKPWDAARGLRELMTGSPELHAHVPDWRPLFFDLAERTPEALLQAVGHWLPTLAVVRAENEERERFQAVMTEVLRRLAGLHDLDLMRWGELLRFVLSWGLRRRPRNEQQAVYEAVRASHQQAELRQEMEQMAHTLGQTWEQELLARGREIGREEGLVMGKAEGEAKGKAEEAHSLLLRQGRKRFGEPDATLLAALKAITDLSRLERMSEAILEVPGWPELLATT